MATRPVLWLLIIAPATTAMRTSSVRMSSVRASSDNFIVRLGKSERQKAIDAWDIGDAWRPGTPNQFTREPKDVVELHRTHIKSALDAAAPDQAPTYASANETVGPYKKVPLVGAMMRTLTLADLALELSSPEPPVLKALRQGDVRALPMSEATSGVPEEVGRLLTTLCLSMGVKRVLDVGCFSGYSVLSAALGMPEGGKITTCEVQPRYARMARQNFAEAPVAPEIELLEMDANKCFDHVAGEEGAFDLIFIDADLEGLSGYYDRSYSLLRPGGLLVLHDTLWSEDRNLPTSVHPAVRDLNFHVGRDRRFVVLLTPLSFGMTFCLKSIVDDDYPPLPPAAVRGSGAANCDPVILEAVKDPSAVREAAEAHLAWLRARREAVVRELEHL